MKHQTKLSQEQQHAEAHQTRQQAGQEFAGADELLRFDAAQTMVPPRIARRLEESTGKSGPPPRRSWWKNLLGQ
ncbi:MAG TPA: hypothetical protein VK815_18800 [Candidatus Acidoferrales bacterium]|jgi:hypothetical protein|nr:hypothetical protein [Candidatus Acidoferrales bacterium]